MELNTEFMARTLPILMQAVPVTLGLTLLVLCLSVVPAFLMAAARISARKWAARAIALYVSFIRGTPIILQILFMYSLLPSLVNWFFKSIGSDFNVFEAVDPFWYACVVFTLNTIALLSEVFRSAILSVPAGQMEAGLSIGLTRGQTYRQIIIPQAMTAALPNICNLTVDLIKGTALAFFMGVKDIMAMAKIQASFGYHYIEAYLDVFILYIIICTVVQIMYKFGEKRIGLWRPAR